MKTRKQLEMELAILKEDRKNLEREIAAAWESAHKYESLLKTRQELMSEFIAYFKTL